MDCVFVFSKGGSSVKHRDTQGHGPHRRGIRCRVHGSPHDPPASFPDSFLRYAGAVPAEAEGARSAHGGQGERVPLDSEGSGRPSRVPNPRPQGRPRCFMTVSCTHPRTTSRLPLLDDARLPRVLYSIYHTLTRRSSLALFPSLSPLGLAKYNPIPPAGAASAANASRSTLSIHHTHTSLAGTDLQKMTPAPFLIAYGLAHSAS